MIFEKLGLPELWKTPKLSECLILNDSGTWGDKASNENGGYPVLRSTNIQDAQLVLDDVAYRIVSQKDVERYRLLNGDILVTKSSGSPKLIGKNAIFVQPDDDKTYLFSNFTQRLRANRDVLLPDYLYFYLNSLYAQAFLDRMHSTTSGLRNLNMNQYATQPIPVPPLPEQARIVAILREADELRRLRQQAHVLVERILPSLYYGIFISSDNSEFDEFAVVDILQPQDGIRTGPFGTQLKVHELVEEGNPVYGIENVLPNKFIPKATKFITNKKFEQLKRYAVAPGDVLLTRMGTVGRACVVSNDIPNQAIISYHLFRLRPFVKRCLPDFLAATLNYSPFVAHQLQNFAYGAVMSGLNADTVRSIKILLPPIETQQSFVRVVEALLAETDNFNDSEIRVDALFQSLLAQAFSGELTAVYRTEHQAELQEAAAQRDIALGLRGQEPRVIDFEQGRVTPAEEEQFRQSVQGIFNPAMKDFLASLGTANVFATLAQQTSFATFADLIRPALPTYENLVTDILGDSLASVNEMMRASLASHAADLVADSITPLATSIQLSNEAFYQSLGQHILALADIQMQQVAQQEPPQPERAIHTELDPAIRAILQAVQALPAYFTPPELHELWAAYGHHFDASQQTDLVQVEAALHLLETLGFVRPVLVDERLVYRLVDPIEDGALLPEEIG